jgi:hypothetical protein
VGKPLPLFLGNPFIVSGTMKLMGGAAALVPELAPDPLFFAYLVGLSELIGALNPDSRCWSGEFSYVPAAGAADLFDIDAHPWGSEASELETRLARAMIDATLHPIPSGFVSVFGALPPENQPVLAIRLSGYISATFELMTACYMPTYRPRSPWRDISGDAIGDSGSDILGWQLAAEWIRPT